MVDRTNLKARPYNSNNSYNNGGSPGGGVYWVKIIILKYKNWHVLIIMTQKIIKIENYCSLVKIN